MRKTFFAVIALVLLSVSVFASPVNIEAFNIEVSQQIVVNQNNDAITYDYDKTVCLQVTLANALFNPSPPIERMMIEYHNHESTEVNRFAVVQNQNFERMARL